MAIAISRHYPTLDSGTTEHRAHYRRAGKGPLLMPVWSAHIAGIAPE